MPRQIGLKLDIDRNKTLRQKAFSITELQVEELLAEGALIRADVCVLMRLLRATHTKRRDDLSHSEKESERRTKKEPAWRWRRTSKNRFGQALGLAYGNPAKCSAVGCESKSGSSLWVCTAAQNINASNRFAADGIRSIFTDCWIFLIFIRVRISKHEPD
jgi:hypothetical protein